MTIIPLPPEVATIYRVVKELERQYPKRKFTPDGHLVGSIGEVVAAKHFALKLHPMSRAGHDAYNDEGDVQIKMTAGKRISMYGGCVRLIVLRIVSPEEAEVVYDGPGEPVWTKANTTDTPLPKNGQRSISLKTLRAIADARTKLATL